MKRASIAMAVACLFLLIPLAALAEYYKWQDGEGNWHFSETPPGHDNFSVEDEVVSAKPVDEAPPAPDRTGPPPVSKQNGPPTKAKKTSAPRPDSRLKSDEILIGRWRVNPGSVQRFWVRAEGLVVVGFHVLAPEDAASICSNCLVLREAGGVSFVRSGGDAYISVSSRDGRIPMQFENQSSVTVEVEAYKKAF